MAGFFVERDFQRLANGQFERQMRRLIVANLRNSGFLHALRALVDEIPIPDPIRSRLLEVP